MTSDVTMVVTSCRRFDLLERTLRSFFDHNDYPLSEVIIIEDSDDARIFDVAKLFPEQPIRIIFNQVNIGQLRSVDKAYAEVSTDYIFHIEDDWEFTSSGTVRALREALLAEPGALMSLSRTESDIPRYIQSIKTRSSNGVSYKRIYPSLHFKWYTFTFNPSLRRTADYLRVSGGYFAIGGEPALNQYYKSQGWAMCWVLGQEVHHIGGDGRSSYSKRKSSLLGQKNRAKWLQSAQRKFWHALRLIGIDTEPMQRWFWKRR